MAGNITGGCECRAVTFRAAGPILDYSHCHCSQCRKMHGAAFASFVAVKKSGFEYLGDSLKAIRFYAASPGHKRAFCGICGSNIMAMSDENYPEDYYLAAGVLDDPLNLPDGYHIYTGSKASWWHITDDLEQFETE